MWTLMNYLVSWNIFLAKKPLLVVQSCFKVRPKYFIQPTRKARGRGGLFMDLSIYPNGGTSADLSKIS